MDNPFPHLSGGDEAYQAEAAAAADDDALTMVLIARALGLTAFVINGNATPWRTVFPNEAAAAAGLAKAVRSIRAATVLVWSGYGDEAIALLRLAYESAGLARVLGKDPGGASDWMRKEHTWPDVRVRRWIRNRRGKDAREGLDEAYEVLSSYAHPSPRALLPLLDADGPAMVARLDSSFDVDTFQGRLGLTLEIALFVMFCARNAAAGHQGAALPSHWHAAVADLMDDFGRLKGSPEQVEHVRRQANEHRRRYEHLQDLVQPVHQLDEALDAHPASWRNLDPE